MDISTDVSQLGKESGGLPLSSYFLPLLFYVISNFSYVKINFSMRD